MLVTKQSQEHTNLSKIYMKYKRGLTVIFFFFFFFVDINFGKRALTGLILDNVYESEVFKKYIESKGWSVKDILRKCLGKLESKHYTCPGLPSSY